jgi:hypothetical protein
VGCEEDHAREFGQSEPWEEEGDEYIFKPIGKSLSKVP